MSSRESQFSNTGRINHNKLMLVLITVCIVLVLVSIAACARKSVNSGSSLSVPVISKNPELYKQDGLDVYELKTLNMLLEVMDLSGEEQQTEGTQKSLHFNALKQYLEEVNGVVTPENISAAGDLAEDLKAVKLLEDKKEIRDMSLDGRSIASNIIREIFDLCGLSIDISINGEIEKIFNQNGKELYQRKQIEQGGFHIEAFIMVMGIIIVLIFTCIIIARKNRLYIKDVRYDGFDEKRFA